MSVAGAMLSPTTYAALARELCRLARDTPGASLTLLREVEPPLVRPEAEDARVCPLCARGGRG